jgi:hypothetical protein
MVKKTKISLFIWISFLLLIVLYSNNVSAEALNPCILEVNLVNQDPNPAVPNSYVDVVFQISGVQNPNCKGAAFELVPSYPFSLDPDEATVKKIEGSTWASINNNNVWNIPYSLRVDKDALDGEAKLDVKYSSGTSSGTSSSLSVTKSFDILIKDSRTNFDAVIQEVSGNDVSIAIANTGKYTANSVVVRIPKQENYMTSETDGQMVGNLDSGDYTIVSFTITSAFQRSMNRTAQSPAVQQNQNNNLRFDIYYTDELGERRTVNMEMPLKLTGNSSTMSAFGGARMQKQTSSSIFSWSTLTKWYFWAIVVVLIILFNYRKKIIPYFNSLNNKRSKRAEIVPNWMNNFKDKEKNK